MNKRLVRSVAGCWDRENDAMAREGRRMKISWGEDKI